MPTATAPTGSAKSGGNCTVRASNQPAARSPALMHDLGLEGARRGTKIRTTMRDDGQERAGGGSVGGFGSRISLSSDATCDLRTDGFSVGSGTTDEHPRCARGGFSSRRHRSAPAIVESEQTYRWIRLSPTRPEPPRAGPLHLSCLTQSSRFLRTESFGFLSQRTQSRGRERWGCWMAVPAGAEPAEPCVELSYVDAVHGRRRCPRRDCVASRFEGVAPVRTFLWSRGERHFPG